MTAAGHAVIGAIIAAKFGNPYIAIPIAIGSHILADMVPHWDVGVIFQKNKNRKELFIYSALDVVVGFLFSFLILFLFFPSTNPAYAFIIIIMSQLLDWVTIPYFLFDFKFPPFTWLENFQEFFNRSYSHNVWGVVTQAAAVIIFLALSIVF